jgi:hypothetical protein
MTAWLERKGQLFRIRFRYGGAKMLAALKNADERPARKDLAGSKTICGWWNAAG